MVLLLTSAVGALTVGGLARAGEPAEISASALWAELDAQLGEQGQALRPLLDRLAASRVPLVLWRQKLREGVAKRAPPARIVVALTRMGENLVWTQDRLVTCDRLVPDRRLDLLALANDVLWSGAEREAVAVGLTEACQREDPAETFLRAGEAHLYLVNRLGAAPGPSWAFAAQLIERDDSQGAINRLMTVFHDVQRKRGAVDRVLERATARLRQGVALRTLRNELREQFLNER